MNSSQQILSLLNDMGLNDKEQKIFFTLLSHGSLPARVIANESGVTRTHVYDIAEDLSKRGLLTKSTVRGVKHYTALEHKELIGYIAKKQSELQLLEKRLSQTSELFNSVQKGKTQTTKVRFHEGFDGIKSVYEEIRADLKKIDGSKELITYWPTEGLEKAYPKFFEQEVYFDMPTLIKRDIINESPTANKYIEAYQKGPTTHSYKIWPKEKGEFPVDVEVWGNKVSFTDIRDNPSGIIIENESVADAMRMWFDHIWESLPEQK